MKPVSPVLIAYLMAAVLFSVSNSAHANQYLNGIDVSHHQGWIDWEEVKNNNISFVIIKCTGGETYTDPEFHNNWNNIREKELYRGAYHFFYAGDLAEAQAQNYLNALKKLRPHDLPPIVDVEILDHESPETLVERLLQWLEIVEGKLGRRPIIYTSPHFADKYLLDRRLQRYPIWLADYGVPKPTVPTTWQTNPPLLWQHTEKGTTRGVPTKVDQNYFMGTEADLQQFLKASFSRIERNQGGKTKAVNP